MNSEDFKKLQSAQLEIMDEIHRVCVENNIEYYIIGGTALGAVRHGGFIPWDLDIDVAMMRPEYDRFKKVCETKLDNRYVYHDFVNTHNFGHPHALVCINNTVLVNKFDKFNPTLKNLGIYLDIFPLDNAPTDEEAQMKQAKELLRIKKLKKYRYGFCYTNRPIEKAVKILRKAAVCWTTVDAVCKKYDDCMRKYNGEETGLVCSMSSHYSYKKQCMPKEVYGTPQLVKFEDRQYFAPEKIDEYLTRIYKDYMKLPPVEEQKENLDAFEKVVFDR